MTLCFSATQALIVAKAGAIYVSPWKKRGVLGFELEIIEFCPDSAIWLAGTGEYRGSSHRTRK